MCSALSPPRPVFCSEGYYDVADDTDQDYHARWQAWVAMLSGCAGYGYGAHGIWQFFDPQDPKGETGKKDKRLVPWSQALQFEGSTMIQPVRSLLSRYPWWQLEPHRDWLLVDGRPSPLPTANDLTPPHCAAVPGQLYLIYIPRGNASRALKLTNLHGEQYQRKWYNPRTGEFDSNDLEVSGGKSVPLGTSPGTPSEDWVILVTKEQ